jgi:enoyl-CoA hydratase/carnithine racemase
MELTGATIVPVPQAINAETVRNFRLALESAQDDKASSVIVLSGGDLIFCRGMELNGSSAEENLRESVESFALCLEMIRTGTKPVIALVRGEAVGGGVGLAAACDAVLATAGATFTLPELLFGLTPAVILPYLAQRVKLQKLRWLVLTADTITSEKAAEIGLADTVCPPEKVSGIMRTWIRKLRRNDPKLIGVWKQMTIDAPSPGSTDGVEFTLERLGDPSVRDALHSFLATGELPWMNRK